MGTTPDPPTGSTTPCTNLGNCSAEQHYASCPVVIRAVYRADALRHCSNNGHDWEFLRNQIEDVPWVAWCSRCNKTLRMVEVPPEETSPE